MFIFACSDSDWFSQHVTPHPEWFLATPYIVTDTDEDISRIWQSKKRCCIPQAQLDMNNREFYKTCVRAISNNRSNEALVVKCLWLMDIAVDIPRKIQIKVYLLKHYK
jgi:hypothetical protein